MGKRKRHRPAGSERPPATAAPSVGQPSTRKGRAAASAGRPEQGKRGPVALFDPLRPWRLIVGPILLLVVTVLAYANAAPDAVVHDDKFFFPGDHRFSGEEIRRFFTEEVWASTGTQSGIYRPLLQLSLVVDQSLHGSSAAGFHLTNIILHLAATLLCYGFLLAALRRRKEAAAGPPDEAIWLGGLLAAALFGVHPIHTEAVDSIFNRSEILVTISVLGALWLLLVWRERRPVLAWTGAALLYLVGLLCKESAVALPALAICLLALFPPETDRRRLLRRLLPALVLLVPLGLYLLLRVHAVSSVGGSSLAAPPWSERLTATAIMLRRCLQMILWPHPLRAAYEADEANAGLLVSLLVHGVVLALTILAWRRRARLLFAGLAFFYLSLLPLTRLVTGPSISALAERFVYLPSAGLALPLAGALAALHRRAGRPVVLAASIVLLLPLALFTASRNRDWQSNVALFEAELRAAPTSGEALRLLSGAYLDQGGHARVGELCDRHLVLHPRIAQVQNHCAIAYDRMGRFSEAEEAYRRAIATGEIGAVLHANLGRLYLRLGRRREAAQELQRAVERETDPARRRYRQAHLLTRLFAGQSDKLGEARAHLEESLRLQPRFGPSLQLLEWVKQRQRALGR